MSPSDTHHSVTIATSSGLGNSLTSSWDPDNLVDTIGNYRARSPELETALAFENGHRRLYLGNSYVTGSLLGSMGESIDLFREKDEGGSESDPDYNDDDCV